MPLTRGTDVSTRHRDKERQAEQEQRHPGVPAGEVQLLPRSDDGGRGARTPGRRRRRRGEEEPRVVEPERRASAADGAPREARARPTASGATSAQLRSQADAGIGQSGSSCGWIPALVPGTTEEAGGGTSRRTRQEAAMVASSGARERSRWTTALQAKPREQNRADAARLRTDAWPRERRDEALRRPAAGPASDGEPRRGDRRNRTASGNGSTAFRPQLRNHRQPPNGSETGRVPQ